MPRITLTGNTPHVGEYPLFRRRTDVTLSLAEYEVRKQHRRRDSRVVVIVVSYSVYSQQLVTGLSNRRRLLLFAHGSSCSRMPVSRMRKRASRFSPGVIEFGFRGDRQNLFDTHTENHQTARLFRFGYIRTCKKSSPHRGNISLLRRKAITHLSFLLSSNV